MNITLLIHFNLVVIDVQPSVEGVAPLVNDLTVNTDFYKFARTVRALFKKSLL